MVIAGEFFRLISPIVSIVSPAVILSLQTGSSGAAIYMLNH
jgi:hypothetical protein